jgi:uncharacterized protein (DUF2267 family)
MKLDAIERTVQKTHAWLHGIGEGLTTTDERVSYHALRAVLHAIRDRLSVDDACSLGAQLPMLVRGIYYEGWHAHGKPLRMRKADDFLELVAANLADDAELNLEPERAIDAVFATLRAHADPGEIEKLVHSMPPDIRTVFTRPPAEAPPST